MLEKAGKVAGKVASTAGAAAKGAGRAAADVARTGQRSAVGYWRGLTYPFKGAKLVYFRNPELIRIWIWPIVFTFVFLAAVGYLSFAYREDVVSLVWSAPVGEAWYDAVLRFLHGFVAVLVFLLMLAVGVVVAILLTNVVSAPFKDLLSEEVERIVIGRAGPAFSVKRLVAEVWRTLRIELLKLFIYLLVMVPLLLVNLIPAVGSIIYSVAGFFFTAVYFAIDYVDWPASRRDRGVRYRAGLVRQHFWPMMGFGTGVWLFLFLPIVNLFFMPAAVAGGTILYLDLEGEGPAPPPPPADPTAAALSPDAPASEPKADGAS